LASGVVKTVGGIVDNTLGTNMSGQNANELGLQAQTQATQEAIGVQQPWHQTGLEAFNALAGNNFMKNWQQDPGYQFQLAEGQKAINNSMSSRGLGNSGAALKALTGYSQNLANQTFQQARDNEVNRLALLTGYGNSAANNISNLHTGLGDANAAAQIGRANQTGNLVNNLFSLAGSKKNGGNGGGATMFSDRRLKKNIHRVTSSEINEMGQILKAYHFNYLSDEHGRGEWIGVMAQDLEKSEIGKHLVVENEQGIKTIDQNKVLSMFLAYFAEAA
jgi:hypothetical protein